MLQPHVHMLHCLNVKAMTTFDLCCTCEYVHGNGIEKYELLKILLYNSYTGVSVIHHEIRQKSHTGSQLSAVRQKKRIFWLLESYKFFH